MNGSCNGCRSRRLRPLIDAGPQPVANKFLASADAPERRFPLAMVQCDDCALIGLAAPVPVPNVVPDVDWVMYNEPEGHLDAVIEALLGVQGLNSPSVVGAVTYKDDSTLDRLRRRGVIKTWRIDPVADLGAGRAAGLETIQDRLTRTAAARLRATHPRADVLLVRHILEHAYDTHGFLDALKLLVRPGGYLVFEVPDCTQVLDRLDYTTLWEEHVLYFTPSTFQDTLARAGFEVVRFDSHPYPYENSLVVVAREQTGMASLQTDVVAECRRGQRFSDQFALRQAEVREFLARHRAGGGRIAMFGAGHLSCMFINLMDVGDDVAFVVDDHPAKRGMFMPGSHLPIRPPEALLSERIDLCLSSLSPESEEKVVARQQDYISRGGIFVSVFPSSRRALALPARL